MFLLKPILRCRAPQKLPKKDCKLFEPRPGVVSFYNPGSFEERREPRRRRGCVNRVPFFGSFFGQAKNEQGHLISTYADLDCHRNFELDPESRKGLFPYSFSLLAQRKRIKRKGLHPSRRPAFGGVPCAARKERTHRHVASLRPKRFSALCSAARRA